MTDESERKSPHILQKGKHWAVDPTTGTDRCYKPGEAVLLTANQAKAFADKFKAASIVAAEAKVAAEMAKEARAEEKEEKKEAKAEAKAEAKTEASQAAKATSPTPAPQTAPLKP